MERKRFETDLKAGDGRREIVAMISTTAVDRDGDVLLPSGMVSEDYRKNPIVLFAHDNQRLPVAKVNEPGTDIRKTSSGVMAKARMLDRPPSLPESIEWVPDTLLDLFRQGAPLGFSVGFRIEDARAATKKDRERFGQKASRVVTKWDLLEFSIVPIPANQDALLVSVSKCHHRPSRATMRALGLNSGGRRLDLSAAPLRRLKV